MKLGRVIQIALIAGAVLMLAASASASTITYSTNLSSGSYITEFSTGSLVLDNTGVIGSGASATLTYDPNTGSTSGVPSNIDYGNFVLACTGCTSGNGVTFGSFTFDLFIDDTTDNAIGEFVGKSTGGTVYSNSSTIDIIWAPVQLGPGTSGAEPTGSASFGPTYFLITNPTGIVAPNSGIVHGETTVQGYVSSTAVPEPATMALVGGAFIGLAALARKRRRG
ncbi:MAG: PEP-CTERM sorting domain-containing protein [Bryobacteraceae bacterium]|jgi:hypothetical protein